MNDVITIGDAMITFDPSSTGPLRFVHSFHRKVGGAELNVAIGCARLGLNAGWISRLGQDEFGRHIHNFVRGEGIDTSEVKLVDGYPTSLNFKEVLGDGSGSTFYYRNQSPILTLDSNSLSEEYFINTRILHITGVFPAIDQRNIEIMDRAISLAKKHNVMITMDPNIRLKLWNETKAKDTLTCWLPDVDVLLTGIEEAEILFGTTDTEEIIAHSRGYGIKHLFVKQGKKGSFHYTDGKRTAMPTYKVNKVVDTVGAGDGFDAGVLYGLLNEWPPGRILNFANAIGAMVVSVNGDNEGLPYLNDVLEKLGEKERIER